jgi:GT2 family glycosyltransferase
MKTTLLTCTADSGSALFRKHRNALDRSTPGRHWEHLVFDNRGARDFNHAREINRALEIARGDYLVLLDDDVIVRAGWLEALVRAVRKTGAFAAGGIHRGRDGGVNHAGALVLPGGHTRHSRKRFRGNRFFPYVCSAVMLIDLARARRSGARFDEGYGKYYHETDFCLAAWERGERVVCAGVCEVMHRVGATARKRVDIPRVLERDRSRFRERWPENGRLRKALRNVEKSKGAGGLSWYRTYRALAEGYRDASARNSFEGFERVLEHARPFRNEDYGREFAGGALYHMGRIRLEADDPAGARRLFGRCLKRLPEHRAAVAGLTRTVPGTSRGKTKDVS